MLVSRHRRPLGISVEGKMACSPDSGVVSGSDSGPSSPTDLLSPCASVATLTNDESAGHFTQLTNAGKHTHINTYARVHTHVYVRAHEYTHTHARARVHTYTSHTHVRAY